MAYEIIKRLTEKQSTKILIQLKEGLSKRDVEKGQLHKVFEDSFDAKPIYHRKFLVQKNQIHTFKPNTWQMETGGKLGGL